MTNLTLEKVEDLDGSVRFHVRLNKALLESFQKEADAKSYFEQCRDRMKDSYPKVTLLENFLI